VGTVPVGAMSGAVVAAAVVAHDITERKPGPVPLFLARRSGAKVARPFAGACARLLAAARLPHTA
jgi:hypothetical protein